MRGGQHQTLLLMSGLREVGHDSILLARKRSPLEMAAAGAGFEVGPANLISVWRCAGGVDLVHAHDARAHTLAALTSREPFVVSRQVAFPIGRSPWSRWKYRRARRYLAVSHYVASELCERGIRPEIVDVVPDAVPEIPTKAGWDGGGPAVALATRDPRKGRELIETAMGLCDVAVRFSADLQADLRGASMFLYISRTEGFGSATLLALAMGVPVIASRVGGLPEVVEHETTGLLVQNDARDIAAAMKYLHSNPGLAQRMGEQGRARVQAKFTKEQLTRLTLDSYAKALNA
jgi:hypothetical protein